MKKIKYTILSLTVACLALIALPACRQFTTLSTDANGVVHTNTINQLDVARVSTVANEAANVGTTEVLTSHPEWRGDFQLAAEQLALLSTSPTIGVQDILSIAQRLPVKELKSQTARLSFEGATLLISAINVPQVPADRLAELQPIAKAIADGITVGIANAPIPPPKPAPAAPPTNATPASK